MELLATHTCDSRHGANPTGQRFTILEAGESFLRVPSIHGIFHCATSFESKIRPAGNISQNDSLRVHYKRPVRINREWVGADVVRFSTTRESGIEHSLAQSSSPRCFLPSCARLSDIAMVLG
jgi:hypothetical protein